MLSYLKRPIETLKDLANFLNVQVNDQDIDKLIKFVSFDNMKKKMSKDFNKFLTYFKSDLEFFNKGIIGNWKNYMNQEQSRRVDECVAKHLNPKLLHSIQDEPSKIKIPTKK